MTVKDRKITRVFIANRGEIARRISQTTSRLGIESVALTDRKFPPEYLNGLVTTFIHVEKESTEIYLNPTLMIEFAKSSHCDAIHPGFGFLSENSEFARLVEQAGLIWIGPSPAAIEAMASKATAREHAMKANVPCLSGLNGIDFVKDEAGSLKQLGVFANQVGFPLLIKASFGGGGKGMRIVHEQGLLSENAKRASNEALSSFGNGSLIVEKYLPAPRHVEVQVLGDKHGRVAIVGDRDCSLQRRHQKILEEAPAPNIPEHIRFEMHAAAKNLAKAVNYDNAGTVEFLLDESDRSNIRYYFLEMNTRLQVEHTVTEEVYGIDLVEWQIRIAQNELLAEAMLAPCLPRGHSIEVRIYAEDPGMDFFPAPGPVRAFVPATGKGIRWEIGIDTVDEISTAFDPMISKLVCTAPDRTQALDLLTQTLQRSLFAGPRNNIPFLIWLAQDSRIRSRPVDTHFIASNLSLALQNETDSRAALQPIVDELFLAIHAMGKPNCNDVEFSRSQDWSVSSITTNAFSKGGLTNKIPQVNIVNCQITYRGQASSSLRQGCRTYFGFGIAAIKDGRSLRFSFARSQSQETFESWIGFLGHNWVQTDVKMNKFDGLLDPKNANDGMSAPVPVFNLVRV
ncbi:MAG: ATP-grasp domain-containing protein [Proteobacteria bacterium]|nr:ATP-grasp domain-containing protein [Pseudomonadota bacterium]